MNKLFILLFFICSLSFISCNKDEEIDGYKNIEVTSLDGTWYINKTSNTITFYSSDEYFTIKYNDNSADCWFDLLPDKTSFSISTAYDSNDEDLMTDEDYENGWTCDIEYKNGYIEINNLPFYRNEKVILTK